VQYFQPRVYRISISPSIPCIICIMSMNLDFKEQQCCIICIQYKLRANAIIQDPNPAFSPDQSMLNFCSAATNGRSAADASPFHAAILPRPVYQSSFLTSKEVYGTSHNRNLVSVLCRPACISSSVWRENVFICMIRRSHSRPLFSQSVLY